jgi:hypothetical protein
MAMVLLLMVGVGLFYLPGLRRDRAVEGGAIVNADPGDEAGPSATIQPAAPLDLRLDTRTNRLQPAAVGAAQAEAPPRAPDGDAVPSEDDAVAGAAIEVSPAATLVAGAVTEAPAVVVEAEQAALEGASGRMVPAARPTTAALPADATERLAAAPAAEERVNEELAPRGPMQAAAPPGYVAPSRPASAQLADDAVWMARRERSVEAPAPSSPARASTFGGGSLARVAGGAGSTTSAATPMPSAPPSMGAMASPLPSAGAATVRTPAALHASARAQAQSGPIRAAIAAYESLLAGHPTYERAPEAMLELAELHRRVGDLTSARAWIARAERSPSYAARARSVRTRIDGVERAPAAAPSAAASE